MRQILAKSWFLALVVLGVVVVAIWPAGMRWASWLDTTVCGTVSIFISALGLESRRLLRAAVEPRAALWAVTISFCLLPGMAWLAGFAMPHEDYRIGLLLMASGPCTLASAIIWTRLAGGDDATALFVTMITNATGWLVTTGWLALTTGVAASPAQAADMMVRLVLVLVVPVIAGQAFRVVPPIARMATLYKLPLSVFSRLLILGVMFKAALEVRDRLAAGTAEVRIGALVWVATACVVIHLIALAMGLWGGRVLKLDRPRRIAAAIAGSQKTLPVSLILFDAYFTGYPLAVAPLVFYHFGQLIVDTAIATALARRGPGTSAAESGCIRADENVLCDDAGRSPQSGDTR